MKTPNHPCYLAERGSLADSLRTDCLTDLLTEDWQTVHVQ